MAKATFCERIKVIKDTKDTNDIDERIKDVILKAINDTEVTSKAEVKMKIPLIMSVYKLLENFESNIKILRSNYKHRITSEKKDVEMEAFINKVIENVNNKLAEIEVEKLPDKCKIVDAMLFIKTFLKNYDASIKVLKEEECR